ncbi:type II secretion system protein [Nostoc sp. UCD121]|uniref:hormogonium polysaccharide secretion pseudopilin HpsB n=1 Tax=unclassified Nostoc TaxID=2593658 RepID=UPI00162AA3E7|nr:MULTISPECIES: hormogonium polysaccharide secretion pseudopilin HpsB [unclassified Nostoc]MBC1222663.1 type II secretion system protein [Nostoc sp. UCD120]MBC1277082.1 type II secretion system protein [Nostoc sp. UCD121]MBC1295560.1 type II secretion system protein [Nostoc sp. UCD122]
MIKHKLQQQIIPNDESGFTIIESLVAIVIVAILMAAIAPTIVISTATRVQSRRVELATQATKTFIDGIRTGAITTVPSTLVTLATPTAAAPRRVSDVAGTPPITGRPQDYLINNITDMPTPTLATGLYCFNKNGIISNPDCSSNTNNLFYIQAGRIVQSTGINDGYRLAIRIYRADVDFSKTLKASTDTTNNRQKTFTGGLGDRQAPLIEMTTDIANSYTTFQALCKRLGVATNQNCQ